MSKLTLSDWIQYITVWVAVSIIGGLFLIPAVTARVALRIVCFSIVGIFVAFLLWLVLSLLLGKTLAMKTTK